MSGVPRLTQTMLLCLTALLFSLSPARFLCTIRDIAAGEPNTGEAAKEAPEAEVKIELVDAPATEEEIRAALEKFLYLLHKYRESKKRLATENDNAEFLTDKVDSEWELRSMWVKSEPLPLYIDKKSFAFKKITNNQHEILDPISAGIVSLFCKKYAKLPDGQGYIKREHLERKLPTDVLTLEEACDQFNYPEFRPSLYLDFYSTNYRASEVSESLTDSWAWHLTAQRIKGTLGADLGLFNHVMAECSDMLSGNRREMKIELIRFRGNNGRDSGWMIVRIIIQGAGSHPE